MTHATATRPIHEGAFTSGHVLTFESARDAIEQLARDLNVGRIDESEWRAGVQSVLRAFGRRVRAVTLETTAPPAPAHRAPRDTAQQLAAEHARVLADSYSRNGHDVLRHAL